MPGERGEGRANNAVSTGDAESAVGRVATPGSEVPRVFGAGFDDEEAEEELLPAVAEKITELQGRAREKASEIKARFDAIAKHTEGWVGSDTSYRRTILEQVGLVRKIIEKVTRDEGGLLFLTDEPAVQSADTILSRLEKKLDYLAKFEARSGENRQDALEREKLAAILNAPLETQRILTSSMADWTSVMAVPESWKAIAEKELQKGK